MSSWSAIASKQSYPDIYIHESQRHVPFAGLRGHDPDGNQYDLSQKGMANVREGYVEFGWEQPRWINHVCIRSGRPAYIAEFYQKVFDLQPVEGMSGDNSYYLTDGKVNLAIRPWDMIQHRGHMAGLDHFGFKVDDLEQTKKDLDAPSCILARFRAEKNRHRPRRRNAPEKSRRLQAMQAKSRRSRRRPAGSDRLNRSSRICTRFRPTEAERPPNIRRFYGIREYQ